MLEVPKAFEDALKDGTYSKAGYLFMMMGSQTRATGYGRWASHSGDDHPPVFAGITFLTNAVSGVAVPDKQVVGGRDLARVRLADPDNVWRLFFERQGRVGHRMEFHAAYEYGVNQWHVLERYKGRSVAGSATTDDDGNRLFEMTFAGPFAQLDPDLAVVITEADQQQKFDLGDTSFEKLFEAWETRWGKRALSSREL